MCQPAPSGRRSVHAARAAASEGSRASHTRRDLPSDGTLLGLGILGVGALGFAAVVLVSHGAIGWPCPWLAITGLNCPLCGATRMFMALFGGDLGEALRFNAPALVVSAVLALLWLGWVAARFGLPVPARILPTARQRGLMFSGIVVLGLLFVVVRNLPWAPFTALAV